LSHQQLGRCRILRFAGACRCHRPRVNAAVVVLWFIAAAEAHFAGGAKNNSDEPARCLLRRGGRCIGWGQPCGLGGLAGAALNKPTTRGTRGCGAKRQVRGRGQNSWQPHTSPGIAIRAGNCGSGSVPATELRHWGPRARRSISCVIVRHALGRRLGYFYFEDEPGRRSAAQLLSHDEAWCIAANFPKLPGLLRHQNGGTHLGAPLILFI
jgi:hypothetical protein